MKKRTNIMICEDVVKRAWAIKNMINDIHQIKREAMKLQLQGEIKEVIVKVIKIYDNQLKEIEAKNWPNWESRGAKYLFRTFTKPYLLDFDERMTDDLDNLSEYQNELLAAMDKIHTMRTKKADYSEYDLYDHENKWIDGGNFKDIYSAVHHINDYDLKTGFTYTIVGNGYKATFKIELNGDMTNLKIEKLKNTIQVTCETIQNGQWIHTTYQTTEYKINDLMLALRTDRNIRDLGTPEPIPTKEYQYTFKLRGMGPGCQPNDFIRFENVPGFKYEVLIYNRQLTAEEIEKFELKALN